MTNDPLSFVTPCRSRAVSRLNTVISTAGTTAPASSITIPLSVALDDWAVAGAQQKRRTRASASHELKARLCPNKITVTVQPGFAQRVF
jgi:hypothetical protein